MPSACRLPFRASLLGTALLVCTSLLAQSYQSVIPTTTLTAETSNNTAAATSFPGCEVTTVTNGQCLDNGNMKPKNVSKVDIHTLLAPTQQGAKVYTTYIPYWGSSNHPNIGYSSATAKQVAREIADLTSRGFDGVLVDWYGPGSWEEQGSELMKSALEGQSKLGFMLMIDAGAINWYSCYPNCTATQALLNTIAFARSSGYFGSPAAIKDTNGNTLVTQFGMEQFTIDWSAVQAANPDLDWVFENAVAFWNTTPLGAYGWLSPKYPLQEGYEGLDYTQYFLQMAGYYQAKLNWASTWKGFNDVVASWAPVGGRHIEQFCGKTWLDSWATISSWTGRLDAVQVVTWHDYEEGTEIQTGIDDCQKITAKLWAGVLNWSVPNESTVDHYTAYISADGQNLMSLGNFAVGTHSVALGPYNFAPGTYYVFVKDIGKPSIVNHMSNAMKYAVQ